MAKKCPEGCTCGKHMRKRRPPCPPECACKRHTGGGRERCLPGCTCKRHAEKPRPKCPEGCTCRRHQKQGNICEPGCTCKRHTAGPGRAAKISASLKGKALSLEHRAALKCQPGCTCDKHTLRNSGQFKAGSSGFTGTHSAETRAKLASYTGEKASSYKHGLSKSITYTTWAAMRGRCYDPRNASYPSYGGRGIKVCERWRDFLNFLADMGERPSKDHSIDRIDPDGNYDPGNCRWATRAEQNAARRDPGGWAKRRQRE